MVCLKSFGLNNQIFILGKPVQMMFIPGDCYHSVKLPGPNDWLSRYKEEGQTFYNFISANGQYEDEM